MLQWAWGCIYLFELVFSFSSHKYPEVELQDCAIFLFLVFFRNLNTTFHSGCVSLHSPQECMRVSFPPCLCQHLLFPVFLVLAILTGVTWHLTVVLIFYFPDYWCWASFHEPVGHLYFFFREISPQVLLRKLF